MGTRAKRAVKTKWRLSFLIELLRMLQRHTYSKSGSKMWELAIYSHSADYITPQNNWLQEALQEVINHFTYSVRRGIQLIGDQMQGGS